MNVFIIGVGLIGGSMALDIKTHYPTATLYGIDSNKSHLKKAIELGIIDNEASIDSLENADLVIIATPVDVQLNIITEVLDRINDSCLLIDVGSTKTQICKLLDGHPKRRNFLATHPIAGTEFSGPTAAHKELFNQKTLIVCEVEKTAFKLQEKALEIFLKMGMRIRYMEPKSHDKHIAYVSHLSHISSFMLGKTVIEKEKNERDIFDMAGSGFASTVRLAKSSPAMWMPIFEQNKINIIETLEEYISNLEQFKKRIEQGDFSGIYNEMERVNYIKQILNGIK